MLAPPHGMKFLLVTGLLLVTVGCAVKPRSVTAPPVPPSPQPAAQASPRPSPQLKVRSAEIARPMRFLATADSVYGETAKGTLTHRGIVAADPSVLPLGSVIHVSDAGAYSGNYVVTDTGEKIIGRHIDIYIPSHIAAKRFGRKSVLVRVIHVGHNRRNHRETTATAAAP